MLNKAPWLLLLLGLLASLHAPAVIIAGGDGQGNTNAPADDPGWANVGQILMPGRGPSSVTYLGNDWFITANHVWQLDNPTGVVANASTYAVDTSSWQRLSYAGIDADLAMFRVTTPVTGLPALTLSPSLVTNGSSVTMIGNGFDRASSLTYWDTTWQVTNSTAGVYSGFYWAASTGTKRWGQNSTDGASWVDDGYGTSYVFSTTFDANGGANEAQGAVYDSGGGVFFKDGSTWELAGLMLTIDEAPGQPLASAVYGNATYTADLALYHDQITAIMAIPEPAGIALAGVAALCALRRIRRWRS
jgi:hypothetical protein